MAKMIPDTPRDFVPSSLEGTMFDGLSQLPDEYYVFHSFKVVTVKDGTITESETDFVIFSPNRGILCIEAKAGHVSYSDGTWCYSSGVEMRHGGPFEQARSNMRRLMHLFEDKGLKDEIRHCKFLYAVWFPSVDRAYLDRVNLPSDADHRTVLTKDDIFNPEPKIEEIFSLSVPTKTKTTLTSQQSRLIINRILSPSFDLFVSCTLDIDLGRHAFRKMIREQSSVIDFLEDQPSAAINGAAGTGKTVLAIEKAQRSALPGDKVLFLCYNRFLRDDLAAKYSNENIDYYTIDGLATYLLGTMSYDVQALDDKLAEIFLQGRFPYKHVIVDEGQDFGQERYEKAGILETLSDIALSQPEGTFYIFYDKMQLVQGASLPKCIDDADCRVTLRRNCRNTENIAVTSIRPIDSDKKPLMRDGLIKGELAQLCIIEDVAQSFSAVESAYNDCIQEGYSDVVILTCGAMDKSALVGLVDNDTVRISQHNVPITTCRKFKGLEADAVILVDVTRETLIGNDKLLFYVGASRARMKLSIVAQLTDGDCVDVSSALGRNSSRRPKKTLATTLNTILVMP